MNNAKARDNGLADQIGQAWLLLFFGLADAVESTSGWNLSTETSNSSTNVMYILAMKVLHIHLLAAMELSASIAQHTKIFNFAGRILEGKTS